MPNEIDTKKHSRKRRSTGTAMSRLVRLMARLRSPNGCPWDRKQTHRSLLPYLIEETYELKDALLGRRPQRVSEELGDLLLQIVFHAQLADEKGHFDLADVADGISDKLVRRHPHVFGSRAGRISSSQVLKNWERLKLDEKPAGSRSVLGGVPRFGPALLRAYRIQEKVAQYGFDWQRAEDVETKLREETDEFHQALKKGDKRAATEELGDLLFTLVNLARHLGVDPETALNATNSKFVDRFGKVEKQLRRKGLDVSSAGLKTLEREWQRAKGNKKK
jgi:tetrapyrrole methylase family protein/MazG family protein